MAGRPKARKITRTPWADVRHELAREVGFGCPEEGCASPYLEWHHFDPEWRIRHHHEVPGMIALCHEHHAKAGAGAFTIDQLREMKRVGAANVARVAGRFDWLRNELLLVSGGITFHETLVILELRGTPVVWFTREADGLLRLNLNVPGPNGRRLQMRDNYWFDLGDTIKVICPTGGRSLIVNYPDGDQISLEFREIQDLDEWTNKYPKAGSPHGAVAFPATVVDLGLRIRRLNIDFKSGGAGTSIFGGTIDNGFFSHNRVGISLDY